MIGYILNTYTDYYGRIKVNSKKITKSQAKEVLMMFPKLERPKLFKAMDKDGIVRIWDRELLLASLFKDTKVD